MSEDAWQKSNFCFSSHLLLQANSLTRQVVNKESPPQWRLLLKACCSMFRRSRSTDFTCAVSQAVRILKICKTLHEIQVLLNFLFKFTRINLVQLNINPVEFHLIRLCSFCNIYRSNDVKFFETPCIYCQVKTKKSSVARFPYLVYVISENTLRLVGHSKPLRSCHMIPFKHLKRLKSTFDHIEINSKVFLLRSFDLFKKLKKFSQPMHFIP